MRPNRKIIFNLYEETNDYANSLCKDYTHKPISRHILNKVVEEIPFEGVVIMTLSDGSKICAAKHDHVKNETYDIYWQ